MPLDPAPVVLEDPIDVSGHPQSHTGLEPAPDSTPTPEPPQDAEPFTEPEDAPKNDEAAE